MGRGQAAARGICALRAGPAARYRRLCRSQRNDAGRQGDDCLLPDRPMRRRHHARRQYLSQWPDRRRRWPQRRASASTTYCSTPFKDFGAFAPDFRIYATLGNHDWRTSREAAMAEVRYLETTPPFYMDGIFYSVKPPAGRGDVEMFVLDTEVLLAGRRCTKTNSRMTAARCRAATVEEPEPWTRPAERSRAQHGRVARAVRCANPRRAGKSSWPITQSGRPPGASSSEARVASRA